MDACLSDDARHFVDLLKQRRILLRPDRQRPAFALHHFAPGGVIIRLNRLHAVDDLAHGNEVGHGDLHGPPQVLEDGLGLAAGQCADSADVILSIADSEIILESRPQRLGEVAVNVWVALAASTEEPAEQQAVADGVDGGDAQ